jgi:hypothetical protein
LLGHRSSGYDLAGFFVIDTPESLPRSFFAGKVFLGILKAKYNPDATDYVPELLYWVRWNRAEGWWVRRREC